MKLKILVPVEILFEGETEKVIAEAENGSFCIEPRHIDFVAALVPGILSYVTEGNEEFVAVDEGILVKKSSEVYVSAMKAVRGADLGRLEEEVRKQFLTLDDRQKAARSAVARLEAGLVRRFIEIGERGYE
jgi:F-type H+-transporting ATPase subunit epsilon